MKSFIKLGIAIIVGHIISLFTVKPVYEANSGFFPERFGTAIYVLGELFCIAIMFYLLTFLAEKDY